MRFPVLDASAKRQSCRMFDLTSDVASLRERAEVFIKPPLNGH
jgi:hypothetical protein